MPSQRTCRPRRWAVQLVMLHERTSPLATRCNGMAVLKVVLTVMHIMVATGLSTVAQA